jgi:glutathione-regulated potassium-efflux system ancillary protein KefF
MKTLVIVSHPYPEQSHVVKALQQTVEQLPGFTVRNLESLYGNDPKAFDVVAEQAASDAADRIVFLFPIHWFNLTPMLKAYLNEVWTYGWAFGPEGTALKGKELVVVATAGATESTYSLSGLIRSTMDEVLTPLKASALYVGMEYSRPLAFFSAMHASEQVVAGFQRDFADRLQA